MSVSGTEITGVGDLAKLAYFADSYITLSKLGKIVPGLNVHHIASRNEAVIRDLTSNGTNAPSNGLKVSSATEPNHGINASIPNGTGTQIG